MPRCSSVMDVVTDLWQTSQISGFRVLALRICGRTPRPLRWAGAGRCGHRDFSCPFGSSTATCFLAGSSRPSALRYRRVRASKVSRGHRHRFCMPGSRQLSGCSGPKNVRAAPGSFPQERGRVVLRITMTKSPEEQRLSLQGQLVGQWAAELRSAWRKAHAEADTRKCIVELTEVTSIDRNGEEVLSEIMSHGGEFVASDVYTKHLLLNLRSELERSRVKEKQNEEGNRS